jgi:hypothetical protein
MVIHFWIIISDAIFGSKTKTTSNLERLNLAGRRIAVFGFLITVTGYLIATGDADSTEAARGQAFLYFGIVILGLGLGIRICAWGARVYQEHKS